MRRNIQLLYEVVKPQIPNVYKWAKDSVSKETIAERLGITRGQLYDLRRKYLDFKLASDGRRDNEQPTIYDPRLTESYINLSGAIIRRAVNDYIRAYYYQLKAQPYIALSGDPNVTSTDVVMKRVEMFFDSGWFELLSLSAVSKDYLLKHAKQEAEFMYNIEDKIKTMDEEQIKIIIQLCQKEIESRKNGGRK